jgi:hypothetical protein
MTALKKSFVPCSKGAVINLGITRVGGMRGMDKKAQEIGLSSKCAPYFPPTLATSLTQFIFFRV